MANEQTPVPAKPVVGVAQPRAEPDAPQTVQLLVGKPNSSTDSMSGLEFTASAIGSLAWPVAAIIIAGIFHRQIAGLLAKIRKLNWGDASVDFAERLDNAEKAAEAVAPVESVPPVDAETEAPDERFEQLVALSPNAAIIENWAKVEQALSDLARDFSVDEGKIKNKLNLIHVLRERGLVNVQTIVMVEELRKLRNAAAHNQPITPADAFRFKDLSDRVLRVLVKVL